MSQATANGLGVFLLVALTLLLLTLLVPVLRNGRPVRPPLNGPAKEKLVLLLRGFEEVSGNAATARAASRGRRKAGWKDVRAACREKGFWRAPPLLMGINSYHGITLSVVGLLFAVPALPHAPSLAQRYATFAALAGAVVAIIDFGFNGPEFVHERFVRWRRQRSHGATPARAPGRPLDAGQDNNLPISGGSGQPAADAVIGPSGGLRRAARWELLRCRKRLAHDVRKQSRRLTKNMMVTQDDIDAAWAKVVILPPAAAPVQRRTLRIRRVVAAVTVAAALFLAFLLGRTSLPAGQYWPALALIAAPFIVYRVLAGIAPASHRALAGITQAIASASKALAGPLLSAPKLFRRGSGGKELSANGGSEPASASTDDGAIRARPERRLIYQRPTIPSPRSAPLPRDPAEVRAVLSAVRLGWYVAEVRGRNRPNPAPGGPGATPGANYALPLRAERTGNELRIEAQAVLCALASELNVDANGASGPSYAMAVDSQAADLARARVTRDDRGAAAYWDRLAELIYRFDAHIQDTMSARCEAQASAYQLGRGLAEAYWALDPGAPCDPRRPDCWTVLLGEQRCDDLIMLAGRLSAYFGPYCLPAIAGTVRIWQSVASDDRWRRGAEDDLYRQLTRWYDLLALSPDPAIFIGPYALAPTRRLFACALRALLPQLITAAISLGLVVALVTFIADGTAGPPLQAVIGVAAAAGLATATVQARFKNGALDLMARLQRDTYTDLVVAAVTEVPAKARRAPAAGSG